MTRATTKTPCGRDGHKYESIDGSDSRKVVGADTHVCRSFICAKCGDVITREIAIWENFVPSPRREVFP